MRKKRMAKTRTGIEIADWKLRFLLEGVEPQRQDVENPFEALVFMHALPDKPINRCGNIIPWFQVWKEIKDEVVVKEWCKTHGEAFAQKELRRFNVR